MNDLGPIRLFLGVTVIYDRERGSLTLSQTPFIDELLDLHNLTNARSQDVPLKSRNFMDSDVPSTALPGYSDQQVLTCAFQCIIGLLLYLATWTRPDLSYTVVALAQCNASPMQAALLAAKGVLQYLKGMKQWGLTYGEVV